MTRDEARKIWDAIPGQLQNELTFEVIREMFSEASMSMNTKWYTDIPTKKTGFQIELIHCGLDEPLATEDIKELMMYRFTDDTEEFKPHIESIRDIMRSFADELDDLLRSNCK